MLELMVSVSGLDHTSKVDEVHDAGLLAFTLLALNDLVECDGDDRVSATTGRIHVGRRHCTACCAYNARTHTHYIGPHTTATSLASSQPPMF